MILSSQQSIACDGLTDPDVQVSPAWSRHPDSWAAYGRFIFAAVHTGCSGDVQILNEHLRYFRRPVCSLNAALVYAFSDCNRRDDSVWTTATRALRMISSRERVDHLNVYLAGEIERETMDRGGLRSVLNGTYIGMAIPSATRDILELGSSYTEFLQSLGHSNRRHMKARQAAALKDGMKFAVCSVESSVSATERYALGTMSRPYVYSRRDIDAWDAYAMAQPRYFQGSLRTSSGELLSCCIGFMEMDSAVIMYQLNHQAYPQLGLSLTFRGFLIEHCTSSGVKRLVLPMGVAGHLSHVATDNPIVQIQFVRRSIPSIAKAILLRLAVPTSHAALLAATPGFRAQAIFGR